MGERRTVLAVAVVLGVLVLVAAAVVHFGMRAGTATSSSTGPGAAAGYTASMRSAVQRPDGSWLLTIHLSSPRAWDEIILSGTEVQTNRAAGPTWPAKQETPIAKGRVPAELDIDFSTPPVPRPAAELFFHIEVHSTYSGLLGSGNAQSSQQLEFATGGGK